VPSLISSGIGWILFTYGRRQQRWPQICCGIALMLYPYFTNNIGAMVGGGMLVGAALCAMLAAGL
jgi:hypothetical protein